MARYEIIIEGEDNPSSEELYVNGHSVTFTYSTSRDASLALKIPNKGRHAFRLLSCKDSPVLKKAFLVEGISDEKPLVMSGTYYPPKKFGRLFIGRSAS